MLIKSNPNYDNKDNNNRNTILLNGDPSLQLESISINGNSCNFTIHDDGSLEISLEPKFYDKNNEIPIIIVK